MSFSIEKNGAWINPTLEGHCYDERLCVAISKFLESEQVKSIVDFGCGPGFYVRDLKKEGFETVGYDGNPYTKEISQSVLNDGTFCMHLDLSEKVDLKRNFDCVISLEVGEHIPYEYESVFLENLVKHADKCVILSWAIEGQGGDGHVNCRNNDYVIREMRHRGFVEFEEAKLFLRSMSSYSWFKNTLMVFWNEQFLEE